MHGRQSERRNIIGLYPYVMDRLTVAYPYVMDRHNDLLLGLMILTDFHVDSSWNQTKKMNRDNSDNGRKRSHFAVIKIDLP